MWGAAANAGFNTPTTIQTVIATLPTFDQARAKYYATTYPGEFGPYTTYDAAAAAALGAMAIQQAANKKIGETGVVIYSDLYGEYWYTDPRSSVAQACVSPGHWPGESTPCTLGQWRLQYPKVQRPGGTIVTLAHAHPDVNPDGSPFYDILDQCPVMTPKLCDPGISDGDNGNPYNLYVERGDGSLFFYKPGAKLTKYFGKVNDSGNITTKYSHYSDASSDADPYSLAANTGNAGTTSDGLAPGVWLPYVIALTGAVTLGFIILISGPSGSGGGNLPPSPCVPAGDLGCTGAQ